MDSPEYHRKWHSDLYFRGRVAYTSRDTCSGCGRARGARRGGGYGRVAGASAGGFQLAELIGSGGIAEVYRGRSASARAGAREVAIKIIYPEFARQPGFLPNFRRIVDMSAKLANHPHILPLLASGEDNGYLYLVTPYVSGGTLREWLLHGGRLGAGDVAPFFRQLCGAVAYAHSLGIVHGNLKPTNVFLFEDVTSCSATSASCGMSASSI